MNFLLFNVEWHDVVSSIGWKCFEWLWNIQFSTKLNLINAVFLIFISQIKFMGTFLCIIVDNISYFVFQETTDNDWPHAENASKRSLGFNGCLIWHFSFLFLPFFHHQKITPFMKSIRKNDKWYLGCGSWHFFFILSIFVRDVNLWKNRIEKLIVISLL